MLERAAAALIRFYRAAVSPITPAACRYTPTCSEYALRAVEAHGAVRGGWLAVRRILRCHPFGGRGWDPVPPAGSESAVGAAGPPEAVEPSECAGPPEGAEPVEAAGPVEEAPRDDPRAVEAAISVERAEGHGH